MTIEEYIDKIDEILDQAVKLPLMGGKILVEEEAIRRCLENIRLNLPKDIYQAQRIVEDRTDIIKQAEANAEKILSSAEAKAKQLVAQDSIVRQANQKANEMVAQAKLKSTEMRKAANDYVDDLMTRTEEAILQNLNELKKAHLGIKQSQRYSPNNGTGDNDTKNERKDASLP